MFSNVFGAMFFSTTKKSTFFKIFFKYVPGAVKLFNICSSSSFLNQVPGAVKSKCWQKIVFSPRDHHCLSAPPRHHTRVWEGAGGGLGGKKAETRGFSGGNVEVEGGGGERVLDA